MTPKNTYRCLLVASIAAPLATVGLQMIGLPPLEPALADFEQARTDADLTAADAVVGLFGVPLILAFRWNWVQLFRFRPTARPWAIGLTSASLLIFPWIGSDVSTWLAEIGTEVGSLCLGAVLISGYCEPFNTLFEPVVEAEHAKVSHVEYAPTDNLGVAPE